MFEGEVRLASNLSKLKSREADERIRAMQVTTVPQDFGLTDEDWYVHGTTVGNAAFTLSGMAAGLFVVVPDEEGGREFYTLVYCDRRGVQMEKVSDWNSSS